MHFHQFGIGNIRTYGAGGVTAPPIAAAANSPDLIPSVPTGDNQTTGSSLVVEPLGSRGPLSPALRYPRSGTASQEPLQFRSPVNRHRLGYSDLEETNSDSIPAGGGRIHPNRFRPASAATTPSVATTVAPLTAVWPASVASSATPRQNLTPPPSETNPWHLVTDQHRNCGQDGVHCRSNQPQVPGASGYSSSSETAVTTHYYHLPASTAASPFFRTAQGPAEPQATSATVHLTHLNSVALPPLLPMQEHLTSQPQPPGAISAPQLHAPPTIDPTEQSIIDATGKVQHPLPKPPPPAKSTAETTLADDAELEQLSNAFQSFNWSNDAVATCAHQIMDQGTPESTKLKGVLQLKQLLCTSREKVFRIAQDVIESGVLRALVGLVDEESMYQLRLAAAFCLTNIAAGSDDQTEAVVSAGGIDPCIKLLTSHDHSLRRQGIFCLANIAGATPELRQQLARRPTYFQAIDYAVRHAMEPKIEELAAWNIRNMCVLGGPTLHEVKGGVEFFADQIHRNVPTSTEARGLIVNGQVSFQAAMNNSVDVGWIAGRTWRPFEYSLEFGHGTAALRFACETFSHISRTQEGRLDVLQHDLVIPILFLAKFSTNHSVRNHSLECVVNLATSGPTQVRQLLEKGGTLIGLAEMLSDHIAYTPHQRVLAARTLTALVSEGFVSQANAAIEPIVYTRDVVRQILDKKAAAESATIRAEQARRGSTGGGRAPGPGIGSAGGDMEFDHLPGSNQDEDIIEERSESEPDDLDLDDMEGISPNEGAAALFLGTVTAQVRKASVLEIAHMVFAQTDTIEEYTLREKCGRLIIAILNRVSEGILYRFLSEDFFKLVMDILEMAVEVDTRQCMIGLPSELAGDRRAEEQALQVGSGTGSMGPSTASGISIAPGSGGASALHALAVGEPELPRASFVIGCLTLLDRLLSMGDAMRAQDGSLDNPIILLMQQQGASGRLESLLATCGGLPFDVIQGMSTLVEKYCR